MCFLPNCINSFENGAPKMMQLSCGQLEYKIVTVLAFPVYILHGGNQLFTSYTSCLHLTQETSCLHLTHRTPAVYVLHRFH